VVLVSAVCEDDPQVVVVEFGAEPGQVAPALVGQGSVPEVPELDDPVRPVLASRWDEDLLPLQVVALCVKMGRDRYLS